jgi:hypothetical protein
MKSTSTAAQLATCTIDGVDHNREIIAQGPPRSAATSPTRLVPGLESWSVIRLA